MAEFDGGRQYALISVYASEITARADLYLCGTRLTLKFITGYLVARVLLLFPILPGRYRYTELSTTVATRLCLYWGNRYQ
jgi:hypothetical protein